MNQLLFISIANFIFIINAQSISLKDPRFENLKEDGFHGLVKENEKIVVVSPQIKIVDAKVCKIEILPLPFFLNGQMNGKISSIPFNVRVLDAKKDKENSEAIIEATRPLNCEHRRSYRFQIRAIACNGLKSKNASVTLLVEDVNEYAPIFTQSLYSASLDEGKINESILRLQANDQDCSAKYSEICKFEIIGGDNPISPFTIDSVGNLANTRPLYLENDSSNYILEVVAYDCGMKRSKPAIVNIKVSKICENGWQLNETSQRIEYVANSGSKLLFPNAILQLCNNCKVENVFVNLKLIAGHHQDCDRNLCQKDAHGDNIDLLANNQFYNNNDSNDSIFSFNGSQHIQYVSNEKAFILSENFSISFWMQHELLISNNNYLYNKHIKEHIICLADNHKKNRVHFAIFIRNCHLILLLRKEYSDDDDEYIFRPVEWKWKLSQVCDKKLWHFFSINVKLSDVQLFVDGSIYKGKVEIVDGWPIHKLANVNTSLVIGACLAGANGSYHHHFNGHLRDLSLLNGSIESQDVIQCMLQCKEVIGIDTDTSYPHMKMNELSIQAKNITELENAVSKIYYINSRENSTPETRGLHLSTNIKCENSDERVEFPILKSYIIVLPFQKIDIILNGTLNLAREYDSFIQGITLFSTISLSIKFKEIKKNNNYNNSKNNNNDNNNKKQKYKLDTCTVQVNPALNPEHEYFRLPVSYINYLNINYKQTQDGFIINGIASVDEYEEILHEIVYFNHKPAYYLNRVFKLICSTLNGEFLSNDYIQTLNVIHPKVTTIDTFESYELLDSIKRQDKKNETKIYPIQQIFYSSPLIEESFYRAPSSHAITIIIVVCVSFLVFLIALGVVRIRAKHNRNINNDLLDQEIMWDDNSLTITVNPLDKIITHNNDDDDDVSGYSGDSYSDESDSNEEDNDESLRKINKKWHDDQL